jgi:hypothetical protein
VTAEAISLISVISGPDRSVRPRPGPPHMLSLLFENFDAMAGNNAP